MVERTVVAAVVMGGVGFGVFMHLLPDGYSYVLMPLARDRVAKSA